MQNLKQDLAIDGVLVTDSKGFEIHNQGFTHVHHLHALQQLSQYFFPGKSGTVIGIETNDFTIVLKQSAEGNMIATKENKDK